MIAHQISNYTSQTNHKSQITNFKQKGFCRRLFGIWLLSGICCLALGIYPLFAQDNLGALKEKYFAENDYSAFVGYLKDLKEKQPSADKAKISYYIALSRYRQLKYLEESQMWDEYFNYRNDYRAELVEEANNAVDLSRAPDEINLYSLCLLWQFHKEHNDIFEEEALKRLVAAVEEYLAASGDIKMVRYAADTIFAYGNKVKARELYNLYVERLLTAQTKDEELKKAAQAAFGQGNLSLALTIYDVYIERVIKSYPKEKSVAVLLEIAKDFAYRDEGVSDPEYAEKIFGKIARLSEDKIADEGIVYLRAYNLEKGKFYSRAKDYYIKLTEDFPASKHYQEALFKSGIIAAYVLRDMQGASALFEKLAGASRLSPQVISGIYQLGLFSQWNGEPEKAKGHYARLIGLAGSGFADTRELAEQRLAELEKGGEIEYNLRLFLDASFRGNYDMSKAELTAKPYRSAKDKDVSVSAAAHLPDSGCMAVEVNYLWSGHLGEVRPHTQQAKFAVSYDYPGTKEINLVVVYPSGILDRNIALIDISTE